MTVLINRIKKIELDLIWLKKLQRDLHKVNRIDLVIYALIAMILIVGSGPQL